MTLSAKISGVDSIVKKLSQIRDDALAGQIDALTQSVLAIHQTAVYMIQDNTDGEPQTRYKPKRQVFASFPGDPPNTDTGRLVQSIQFEIDGNVGYVGTNLVYGAWLEFGTKNMAPRPWLSVAVESNAANVGQIFADAVRKVFT